jgi:hypothetical protein
MFFFIKNNAYITDLFSSLFLTTFSCLYTYAMTYQRTTHVPKTSEAYTISIDLHSVEHLHSLSFSIYALQPIRWLMHLYEPSSTVRLYLRACVLVYKRCDYIIRPSVLVERGWAREREKNERHSRTVVIVVFLSLTFSPFFSSYNLVVHRAV